MVLRRLAWLRLLVTALLCAAGLARPVSARWDDAGTQRIRDPIHVSAASVHGEIGRIDERSDDTRDVGAAPVDPALALGPALCRVSGSGPFEDRPLRSDRRRRPRARGPPTA